MNGEHLRCLSHSVTTEVTTGKPDFASVVDDGALQTLDQVQLLQGPGGELVHLVAAVADLVVQQVAIQWRRLGDGLELDQVLFRQGLLAGSSATGFGCRTGSTTLPSSLERSSGFRV